MASEIRKLPQPTWLKAYDPADSPGPIPSVIVRFRRRGHAEQPEPSEAEIEAARYTVVLVPPEASEALGDGLERGRAPAVPGRRLGPLPRPPGRGLKVIEEACGERVVLTERRSDLTYWTANLRHPN